MAARKRRDLTHIPRSAVPPPKRKKAKPAPAPKALEKYGQKRDFGRTPEPGVPGAAGAGQEGDHEFVVQMHAARRLHYDFYRLPI